MPGEHRWGGIAERFLQSGADWQRIANIIAFTAASAVPPQLNNDDARSRMESLAPHLRPQSNVFGFGDATRVASSLGVAVTFADKRGEPSGARTIIRTRLLYSSRAQLLKY